jgi:hypothetical protein
MATEHRGHRGHVHGAVRTTGAEASTKVLLTHHRSTFRCGLVRREGWTLSTVSTLPGRPSPSRAISTGPGTGGAPTGDTTPYPTTDRKP